MTATRHARTAFGPAEADPPAESRPSLGLRAIKGAGTWVSSIVKLGAGMAVLSSVTWWIFSPRIEDWADDRAQAVVTPLLTAQAAQVAAAKIEAHDAKVGADIALTAMREIRIGLGVLLCPPAGGRPGREKCYLDHGRPSLPLDDLSGLRDAIEERRLRLLPGRAPGG